MLINEISFEAGSLETMIERLFKTMNAIDKQWSGKVEPASQKQIHALEEISGLKQHGKSIPYAYLLFLEEMGQNDNGLLEQEWDGDTEVNIDSVLRDYLRYIDNFDIDKNKYMMFSTHWSESALFLKLTGDENPPVYRFDGQLFLGSFENYLFQMAFRKMQDTQYLYQIELAASPKKFREIVSAKSVQSIQWTTQMEWIEYLMEPYQLQKAWFSDEVHFYGISAKYSIHVDLNWALNIIVSSDDHSTLQKMNKSLARLFGIEPKPYKRLNKA
ncbi:MAG: hypothetical protein K2L86_01535 [Lachnospiraceae bacterium]|nr:hypothetical protein [Lachnospiraceae bacterium]